MLSLTQERPKNLAIQSLIHKEQHKYFRDYEDSAPMESIDWQAVEQAAAAAAVSAAKMKQDASETTTSFAENAFVIDDNDDEEDDMYEPLSIDRSDATMLNRIGDLLEVILVAFDAYENLWTPARKAQEDLTTQYGKHLARLQEGLYQALVQVFDDVADDEGDQGNEDWQLFTRQDLPKLQAWFRDMVFGFGRSPTSLQAYLEQYVYSQPNVAEHAGDLALVQRLREYMAVREAVGRRKLFYQMFLRSTYLQLVALHKEFVQGLTESYSEYAKAEGKKHADTAFEFRDIDRWDMENPEHTEFLSDYEAFSSKYLHQRQPVVLSNVNKMTHPFNYTKEFLVEKCGFVDVSTKIRTSFALGDTSVTSWGGLEKFILPREFMTNQRRSTDKEGKEEWDTSVSLEQFVQVAERLDSLYLHDFALKMKCVSLFWEDSPYDASPNQQFFRIPSAIGRYDLFQRLPSSTFANSWPSLFIGRKGSNSKLHIDNGATGFWMFLASGRKRWIIYDAAERPYLYQRNDGGSFMADVLALNATQHVKQRRRIHNYFDARHPLLHRASAGGGAYEFVQEPGDLVYIPPNSPHAVENLEDIVGISFNLVPRDSIAGHLFNTIHRNRAYGSLESTLRYLMLEPDRRFELVESNPEDPLYTTLGEYVAQ